ncbi:MAG TPA: FtsX-like permease family protein, partial [Candidatus Omnitrophica bacterium]|nr:FtsX-like permease family protein [Candidatus Omnitrophota bacterium]
MKKTFVLLMSLLLGFTTYASARLDYKEIANKVSQEKLKRYIFELSTLGYQKAGEYTNRRGEYLYQKFKDISLTNVKKETYQRTVPIDKGAYLTIKGTEEKIELYCLSPNMVRTPTLPPKGIEGPLIYGRDGEISYYNGKEIQNSIVLLDFNCGKKWVDAFMLGARAVIFIEPEDTTSYEAEQKVVEVPLDAPRFWIKKEDGGFLLSKLKEGKLNVKLTARMNWEWAEEFNVLGYVEGTDPELKEELIIITASYKKDSVVPRLSYGAEQSCGIAALLQIAQIIRENPIARSVLFLAAADISDFVHRHLRKVEPYKSEMEEPIDAKLLIVLDLSSGTDELGLQHRWPFRGDKFKIQKAFAPLGKKFQRYSQQICEILGYDVENTFTNLISPVRGISWESIISSRVTYGISEIVIASGTPTLNLITIHDSRSSTGTPLDTPDKVKFDNLYKQVRFLACLLIKSLNDKELFSNVKIALKDELRTFKAKLLTFDPRESFVPNNPVANGDTSFLPDNKPVSVLATPVTGPWDHLALALVDEKGEASFPNCKRGDGGELLGFCIDRETGAIVGAPDNGPNGEKFTPRKFKMTWKTTEGSSILFKCKAINMYELIDSSYLIGLTGIEVFNKANSTPLEFYSFMHGTSGESWTSSVSAEGVIFTQPGEKVKVLGLTGPLGKRLLLTNASSPADKEQAQGEGYDTEEITAINLTPYKASKDMWTLNEYRLNKLKRFGISNQRLEELHARSKDLLKKAEEMKKEKRWDEFVKFSREALASETKAYPDVKATANDVIRGIIFYMAILLPFSFFMEKLTFGSSDIKKQLGGSFLIFLIVYIIVRFAHPAFYLAHAPEVILLGFILLALATIVISFVSGKFEEQMQQLKRKKARVHEADIGRISATAAAFSLGVSNMKRRKMRTLLTSVTLILLTFTVLSFTSVKTYLRYSKIQRQNEPSYEGILIRDNAWYRLEDPAYFYTKDFFRNKGTVTPRGWYFSGGMESDTYIKIRKGERFVYAKGLLGMTHKEDKITELGKYLIAGRWFKEKEKNVVIIPEEIAFDLWASEQEKEAKEAIVKKDISEEEKRELRHQLRLKSIKKYFSSIENEPVNIFGKEMNVIGVMNSFKLGKFKDLDGESITPVDFTTLDEKQREDIKRERVMRIGKGEKQIRSFVHLFAANTPIVPYEFVRNNGGTLQSIAVKFNSEVNIVKEVENFLSMVSLTIFVGTEGKTWAYTSMGATSFRGMANLLIPILLASLIVLNTMLGSVYERIREIGTYSSVGLAPVHISSLFIAESCVYAILGAVAGYLVGQIIAKVVNTFGLLPGLTLN